MPIVKPTRAASSGTRSSSPTVAPAKPPKRFRHCPYSTVSPFVPESATSDGSDCDVPVRRASVELDSASGSFVASASRSREATPPPPPAAFATSPDFLPAACYHPTAYTVPPPMMMAPPMMALPRFAPMHLTFPLAAPATPSPPKPATGATAAKPPSRTVSYNEALAATGTFAELALTAAGSSFVQAVLHQFPTTPAAAAVVQELVPFLPTLLLHNHGCYAARALLEAHPAPADKVALVAPFQHDDALWVALCCKSLHTRRVAQVLLESLAPVGEADFMFALLRAPRHVHALVTSKDGCIVAQRLLERCAPAERDACFAALRSALGFYACHEHANYVVQLMVRSTDAAANAAALRVAIAADPAMLCHRVGSTVAEAVLLAASAADATLCAEAVFAADAGTLCHVANDNYGNYVVQKLIAIVSRECIEYVIVPRLLQIFGHLNFGAKLLAKCERRME